MIFFFYFFRNFHARVEYEQNLGLKYFSLLFGLSYPILAKNNAEKRFFNFWIFYLFFSEFPCPSRVWTEFGTNIFFLTFSAYRIPFQLEIKSERCFLIFWIFLLFFSEFSCPGRIWTEFGSKFFFFLFFGLPNPVLVKNNAGKVF